MESDKWITVCESVNGVNQIAMIDLYNGNTCTRQKISAEAAIMNPVSKVIALRAQQTLQVFNLELRAKMKSFNLPAPIVYWRWTSPNTIALVTAASVFHWSIENDTPTKIFDRNPAVGDGTQVINYQVSNDQKWCLLCAIAPGATPGVINGNMQLYSVEKAVSQMLQGHSGVFSTLTNLPGRPTEPAQVLCFAENKNDPANPPKLYVMEIGRSKDAAGGVFRIAPQNIPMAGDAPNDFPMVMTCSNKNNIVFMITKAGYVFAFDIFSGKAIYRFRITSDPIFVATAHEATGGALAITRRGQVFQISLNESALIPFVVGTLRDQTLAIALASRLNLPGADEIYVQQFNTLLASNDLAGAANVAATSPRGFLRTPGTIMKFQQIPATPGQPAPVFQYFSVLLEKGKLNQYETIELSKPVLQQGKLPLIQKWIDEDKLEMCEELGDLLLQQDANLALTVYLRATVPCPEKVINCMMQRGEFDKIVAYAAKVNYRIDYQYMLSQVVRNNPTAALELAKMLNNSPNGRLMEPNTIFEIFMSCNLIREATAFLLDALKNNLKEEGFLQTKVLEINLLGGNPQVADAILANSMFSYYDKPYIGKLCEQAGLIQRALEHYTDVNDVKRVMQNAANMPLEFILSFFGSLSQDTSLEVLREMLARNMRQNLPIVVQIATKYSDPLGPENLIKLLEDFKSFEGIFHYLGAVVNVSQVPLVHLKYIEAAAKMGQFKEVERVCRDSTVYDPEEVKKFLTDAKLPDPRPLIHVCDRFDYIDEMTNYLYVNNLQKYIEVYVTKVSPQKTPQVIGKLLDLECSEEVIKGLLMAVGPALQSADELVEQVERRNRLRLLLPWLESRVAQGSQEPAVHNALGKILITLNRDPLSFLNNNQFYQPAVLGAFCEKLDPHLAFVAYKAARGECDEALIKVTMDNGLYKDLARYLVERQDLALWERVLKPEGFDINEPEPPSRRYVLDQVVQTALPESRNPDEVSTTVKAFMQADLPGELIELLERIVLQGSDFSNNKNLQNLLILTAIRAEKTKVMEYINRLDNFDGPDIAKIACSEEHNLFEEAFAIYTKFAKRTNGEEQANHNIAAVEVLVDHIKDLERAKEFSERVNIKPVWSRLAKAQLRQGSIQASIDSYIKATDSSDYSQVIYIADEQGAHEELVKYLKMVRKTIKETVVDTQMIYSLARVNKLTELEELISVPNVAKIDAIGERCFKESLFEAARILFININNNAKLALCYINMKQYREAVDAATKANSVPTWKEVNLACLQAGEYRLANMAGLHIIVHPDHLEELIGHYERAGKSTELIQLMEQGLGLDHAHSGVFTELGVLYSKYNPEKLMEHVKIFHSRMNSNKMLRACERALLWNEAVYLYKEDGQFDNAVKTMVDHTVAFHHDLFLDCVLKVRNPEIQYKAITFYLSQHPLQLVRLLQVLTPNIDHARVVNLLRRNDALSLAMDYLKSVQKENLSAVNEALNDLYIADEDYAALRGSADDFDNFDQILLAQKLEKHELLEFRRISAYLYKRNKRWSQSVALSKLDRMYKDAIDTSSESGDAELVEELLRYFVEVVNDKACFSATLFTCYDLIRPDTAIELAWRHGYVDNVMPYVIQYMRHTHDKIKVLDERTAPPKEEEAPHATNDVSMNIMGGGMMVNNNLLIGDGSVGGPAYGSYGNNMGGIPDPYSQPMNNGYGNMGMGMGMGGMDMSMGMGNMNMNMNMGGNMGYGSGNMYGSTNPSW